MTAQRIYEVLPDDEFYRSLVWETDWEFDSQFMRGTPISQWRPPVIRYRSLEEDLAYEAELRDIGDDGDPVRAERRLAEGIGDCVYVSGFRTGLVFSPRAEECLGKVLGSSGQLFSVPVDNDEVFFFNCTRVIHALDDDLCEIRCVSNNIPSQITRAVFRESVVKEEMLFRTHWPEHFASQTRETACEILPPLTIFATHTFVELVERVELTGFRFREVK